MACFNISLAPQIQPILVQTTRVAVRPHPQDSPGSQLGGYRNAYARASLMGDSAESRARYARLRRGGMLTARGVLALPDAAEAQAGPCGSHPRINLIYFATQIEFG